MTQPTSAERKVVEGCSTGPASNAQTLTKNRTYSFQQVDGLEKIYFSLGSTIEASFVFESVAKADAAANAVLKDPKMNDIYKEQECSEASDKKIRSYSAIQSKTTTDPIACVQELIGTLGDAMKLYCYSKEINEVPIAGSLGDKQIEEFPINSIDGLKEIYVSLGKTPEVSLVFNSTMKAKACSEAIVRSVKMNVCYQGQQYTVKNKPNLIEALIGGNLSDELNEDLVLSYSAKQSGTIGNPIKDVEDFLQRLGKETRIFCSSKEIKAVPIYGKPLYYLPY